jgi:hypothetical protein
MRLVSLKGKYLLVSTFWQSQTFRGALRRSRAVLAIELGWVLSVGGLTGLCGGSVGMLSLAHSGMLHL